MCKADKTSAISPLTDVLRCISTRCQQSWCANPWPPAADKPRPLPNYRVYTPSTLRPVSAHAHPHLGPAGAQPFIWSSWVLPPRRTFPGRAQSPARRCGRRGRSGCWPCWAGRGTRCAGSAGTLWPPPEAAADCGSSRCTQALRDKGRVLLLSSTGYGIYFFKMLLERCVDVVIISRVERGRGPLFFTCGSVFQSCFTHLYSGRVERDVSILRRRHKHHIFEELQPWKDQKTYTLERGGQAEDGNWL